MEGNQPGHEQSIAVKLGDGIEFDGTISVSDRENPQEVCEQVEHAVRDALITVSLEL